LEMRAHGLGSPVSVVAADVLKANCCGRPVTAAAFAKSSFGGRVPVAASSVPVYLPRRDREPGRGSLTAG